MKYMRRKQICENERLWKEERETVKEKWKDINEEVERMKENEER